MWKHRNRIEYPTKIGKWREKERRYDRHLIKCLGKKCIDKPKGAEKVSQQEDGNKNYYWMYNEISAKKERNDPSDKSNNKATHHSSDNMTEE